MMLLQVKLMNPWYKK